MDASYHRHDISDAAWELIAPYLPGQRGQWGGIAEDNRRFINAVFWVLRTGAPWRDLPPDYGKWGTVHQRFIRWRSGFLPYVKDIPEDVARKAKYMIVSLPANPVGSVGSPALYAELVAFAKKYDILIIHDNAYSDIIFDGAVGNSFFNTPGAMDVGVEFFSLSKSFNVTGARISFLVGRRDVVAAFKKLRGQIDFGMFLPVQKAAIAALTGPLDMVKTQCGLYQQRRDALCGGLRSIGWNVPDSHGSMFVWAPIPAKYAKSMDFCLDLVEKSGVLCTPGSSFGPLGEGYVRFALTLPPERIAEAVQSIKASGILN